MVNPNRFYTYAYLREDRTPYYIGKGNGDRAYKKGKGEVNPPKDKSRVIFLKQNLTEEKAFNHEEYMIAVFGRKDLGTGILRNKTNGREGASGAVRSEETKTILRQLNTGENHPSYGRRWWNDGKGNSKFVKECPGTGWVLGHTHGISHSEETKRILRQLNTGENNPNYGKSASKETRRKMSETRKKIGIRPPSHKGRKWWNDGKTNKVCVECPGEGWVAGRIKRMT